MHRRGVVPWKCSRRLVARTEGPGERGFLSIGKTVWFVESQQDYWDFG